MTREELRDFFVTHGSAWVRSQADRHRARALPMTAGLQAHLGDFFGPDAARARLVVAQIENPPFYGELARWGVDVRDLIPYTMLEALTFDDVIVLGLDAASEVETLFHELVHVVQYRILGVEEFSRQYVEGWLAGRDGLLDDPEGRYLAIPIEAVAYELQARFEAAPDNVFSVEQFLRERPG